MRSSETLLENKSLGERPAKPDCLPGGEMPHPPPSTWTLGRLIPMVLVIWICLDFFPRFLPLNWLDIYPFQLAARKPGRYAPFIPNLQIHARNYVGEMALMGNLPPTEVRDSVWFTTDENGFRKT